MKCEFWVIHVFFKNIYRNNTITTFSSETGNVWRLNLQLTMYLSTNFFVQYIYCHWIEKILKFISLKIFQVHLWLWCKVREPFTRFFGNIYFPYIMKNNSIFKYSNQYFTKYMILKHLQSIETVDTYEPCDGME